MKVVEARQTAPEKANGKPYRWEYRQALMELDADLAQFGAEGWECFSVVPMPGDRGMYFFKRRVG